jgi:hypothetical protein
MEGKADGRGTRPAQQRLIQSGVVAVGAARALGGADGKRLTCYTTACHWDQARLHGPCVSGTRLHFDRPSGSGQTGRDGRSDRSRLTRTQA